MEWIKSSYSDYNGECVEVSIGNRTTRVRDTKHRQGPVLVFDHTDWQALLGDLRAGRLERS